MEQHPVPQNVTTFQFRLIGDMTIKQFGYLAGGIVFGYVSLKLPLPFFFTWPLAGILGFGGFGLAFVPVEERPMDVWVAAFLKNVYNPTQYVWQKAPLRAQQSVAPVSTPINQSSPKTGAVVQQLHQKGGSFGLSGLTHALSFFKTGMTIPHAVSSSPLPSGEGQAKQTNQVQGPTLLSRLFTGGQSPARTAKPLMTTDVPQHPTGLVSPTVLTTAAHPSLISRLRHLWQPVAHTGPSVSYPDIFSRMGMPSITGKRLTLNEQSTQKTDTPSPLVPPSAINTPHQQVAVPQKTQVGPTEAAVSQDRLIELQRQLTQVLTDREKLERELVALRKSSQQPHSQVTVRVAPMSTSVEEARPTVRIISPEAAVRAGVPRLTSFPNIITGVIKDPNGNLLPGMLVTVRDKTDMPLRALKSNKLGQFAASTPLPAGTYVIEIEDPRKLFVFDRVQILVNNGLLPTIEVSAKSQKQVEREKLTKAIFGDKQ